MNLELQADRDEAETVACPPRDERGCGQPAGHPCLNLTTGEPLDRLPAHDARLKAAGVLHAPLDSRELARDDHQLEIPMSDTLFDVDEPPPPEQVSPDRRRTRRQADAISRGVHPLSVALGVHIGLHQRAAAGRDSAGLRCGDCRFRRLEASSNRAYPKCTLGDGRRVTHGAGTDVRAWWPACPDLEVGDSSVSWPDAARWAPVFVADDVPPCRGCGRPLCPDCRGGAR